MDFLTKCDGQTDGRTWVGSRDAIASKKEWVVGGWMAYRISVSAPGVPWVDNSKCIGTLILGLSSI